VVRASADKAEVCIGVVARNGGGVATKARVALLTAGRDRHYVIGLLRALQPESVHVDCIAGDAIASSDVVNASYVEFHNFARSLDTGRSIWEKVVSLLGYYARLVAFAARTDARVFHILWFRKFPRLEGLLLTSYFRLLGKKLLFTAHNVDADIRDGKSTICRRLALRFLYHTVDHILVHTAKMKDELTSDFGVRAERVTVVPFGINDVIPRSKLTRVEARRQLGFDADERVLLFFGTIVPYKGLEDLVDALALVVGRQDSVRLIIAGPVWNEARGYWQKLAERIDALGLNGRVRKEIKFKYLPDEEVAMFFRAADVSMLPYRRVYQSGVLALSYSQGLPVIAAGVGSLAEDIVEGKTGLLFKAGDVADLADTIQQYFKSDLYRDLENRQATIRQHGEDRFSWRRNAGLTAELYQRLARSR
jgi:D-inositol-3-phosphate glycosyltransferase